MFLSSGFALFKIFAAVKMVAIAAALVVSLAMVGRGCQRIADYGALEGELERVMAAAELSARVSARSAEARRLGRNVAARAVDERLDAEAVALGAQSALGRVERSGVCDPGCLLPDGVNSALKMLEE